MKFKFGMIGKDETKIKIQVEIDTTEQMLTRDEAVTLRERMKNKIHDVLRESGYDVSQIRVTR